jgi:type IV secretory pathway TrbL component
MKILTLRRIVGIAAIGVAYVHGKRGGDWTLASIGDTMKYVWTSTSERLGIVKGAHRPISDRTAGSSRSSGAASSTSSGVSGTSSGMSGTSSGVSGTASGSSPGTSTANGLTGDRTRRPYNG